MIKTTAIILAGGSIKEKDLVKWQSFLPDGVLSRALIPLCGKSMLFHVAKAVQETGLPLIIAGGVPCEIPHIAVSGGASLVDTLIEGIAQIDSDVERVLIITADIPFIRAEHIHNLLLNAPVADFVYPIIPIHACKLAFPQMKRTALITREGEFTGGNMVLLNPGFVRTNEQTIRLSFDRRKDVVALARLLGAEVILRLILARFHPALLPIYTIEQAVSRLVGGASVRAMIVTDPEVGTDIDTPEDLVLAQKMFRA